MVHNILLVLLLSPLVFPQLLSMTDYLKDKQNERESNLLLVRCQSNIKMTTKVSRVVSPIHDWLSTGIVC